MSSHRLVRVTTVALAAALATSLVLAFDAAANGTTLTVPYRNYISGEPVPESSIPMFEIKQNGSGIGGRFEITNPNSASIALDGVSAGTGHALLAWNLGLGRGAVIITSNSQNTLPALDTSSQSLGIPASPFSPGLAAAADIRANNSQATAPAVQLSTLGQNTVLNVNHRGPTGRIATFQTAGKNEIFLNRDGSGYFSSEVRAGNHGVTEAIVPEGLITNYQRGDVLSVSTANDERVTKSTGPYSRLVIGVNADPAGVVLSDQPADSSLRSRLKVGILGLFPVKVNVQNGPINRGDLLVTSSTVGVAMRATEFRAGAMIGKAMGRFPGPGTGIIPVLISLQ